MQTDRDRIRADVAKLIADGLPIADQRRREIDTLSDSLTTQVMEHAFPARVVGVKHVHVVDGITYALDYRRTEEVPSGSDRIGFYCTERAIALLDRL